MLQYKVLSISIKYFVSASQSEKKYRVRTQDTKNYVTLVSLEIIGLEPSDFGTYFCVAKNSLGDSDGAIRLTGLTSSMVKLKSMSK